MNQTVYFVGSPSEVAHHAAPLKNRIPFEICEPDKLLHVACPGDLAIFYSEHFDRFRNCVRQLKQKQVATLYLIDGILEWRNAWENREDEPACPWTMRPALSDKVACVGATQMMTLNSWGNQPKTELVGIPRLDSLQSSTAAPIQDSPAPFRLLLMSAKCPGFTDEQIENTFHAFQHLKAWLHQNPTVEGRPIDLNWRLTGDLANRLDVKNQCSDLTGVELADAIQSSDAVITTASTSMLEAMILGRPVALLDYHNTPHLVKSAWCISAEEHISSVVQELATRPRAKMLFQQSVLQSALQTSEKATDRLLTLIQSMLQSAASVVQQSSIPLEFKANILAPVASAVSNGFDHQELYPVHDSFRESDRVEVQAELGHARREIEHLHREIDQLQSELGQAHEIFDQIQQHPIAGPIVRIRQRLIDWLGRRSKRSSASNASEVTPTTSTKPTVSS